MEKETKKNIIFTLKYIFIGLMFACVIMWYITSLDAPSAVVHISDSFENDSEEWNCTYILEKSKGIELTEREIEVINYKCPLESF